MRLPRIKLKAPTWLQATAARWRARRARWGTSLMAFLRRRAAAFKAWRTSRKAKSAAALAARQQLYQGPYGAWHRRRDLAKRRWAIGIVVTILALAGLLLLNAKVHFIKDSPVQALIGFGIVLGVLLVIGGGILIAKMIAGRSASSDALPQQIATTAGAAHGNHGHQNGGHDDHDHPHAHFDMKPYGVGAVVAAVLVLWWVGFFKTPLHFLTHQTYVSEGFGYSAAHAAPTPTDCSFDGSPLSCMGNEAGADISINEKAMLAIGGDFEQLRSTGHISYFYKEEENGPDIGPVRWNDGPDHGPRVKTRILSDAPGKITIEEG